MSHDPEEFHISNLSSANCKSHSMDYLKLAGVAHMSSTAKVCINTRYCHKSHLVMIMAMVMIMTMVMMTMVMMMMIMLMMTMVMMTMVT